MKTTNRVLKITTDGSYPLPRFFPEKKLNVRFEGCTSTVNYFSVGVEKSSLQGSNMKVVVLVCLTEGEENITSKQIEFFEMVYFTEKTEIKMTLKDISSLHDLEPLLGHVLESTCEVIIGADGVELRSDSISPPSIYIPISDDLEECLGLRFPGEH